MNDKVFVAKISWLTADQCGRKQGVPLYNDKYCPIVSVDGEKVFNGSTYGLLSYSFKRLADYEALAQIRFLNTEAAPDVLYVGAKLELYEGTKKVAEGEVIETSDFKFNF